MRGNTPTKKIRRRRKMKKVNEIIKAIEKVTEFEDLEFIEFDGNAYQFIGFNQDDEEVEIKVTVFNEVFANGKKINIYLPINAWPIS